MKRKIIFGISIVFVTVLSLGLMGVANAYGALLERQVNYRYIDEALSLPQETLNVIRWGDPVRPLVRQINEADRRLLDRRIGDAWTNFALAQDTGDTEVLADWFGGMALSRAKSAAQTAFEDGSRMVVLRMAARPSFYHLDGSILQLEVDALTVRYLADKDGLSLFELGEDHTVSTLVNRSTGWHVAAHERRDWDTHVRQDRVRPVPELLAGINYYPAATPWRLFWPNYDASVTARDLDLIQSLGANAVRIFLPRENFLPATSGLEARLGHLRDFLDQAATRNLEVIATLFDLKGSYSTATWTQDIRYLDTVLPVLRDAPAVALVDLKNEPDLDFKTQGRGHILAWLRSMAAVIREDAPDLALTIGWSDAGVATELWDILDALSYHDYAPIEGASKRLKDVQALAGGLPVLVTEIGVSSWSLVGDHPSSPKAQDAGLTDRMGKLASADGVFLWTLHDFPDPDQSAIGSSFWVRGLQSRFGLYDEAGQPKPAAATVAEAFKSFLKGIEK
jgi:hypothetical protein